MPMQTLIKHPDWFKVVQKKRKFKHLQFAAQPFEFSLDLPKDVLAAMKDDPLLQARVWDAASQEWNEFVDRAASQLGSLDDKVRLLVEAAAKNSHHDVTKAISDLKKQADDLLKTLVKGLETKIEASVDKAWAKIQKDKAEFKKYKVKKRVKIGVSAAAIGLTGLSLVASGGTNAFAWYALTKQTIATGRKVYMHCRKLGPLLDSIDADLKKLSAATKKHPKLEMGNTAFNSIMMAGLGSDVTSSALRVERKIGEVKARRMNMVNDAHSMSKSINKLLTEISKAQKSGPKLLKKDYTKLETALGKMLAKISDNMGTAKDIEVQEKAWAQHMKKLNKAQGAKAIDKTITALAVTASVARAIAMDLSSDDSMIEAGINALESAADSAKSAAQDYTDGLGRAMLAAN